MSLPVSDASPHPFAPVAPLPSPSILLLLPRTLVTPLRRAITHEESKMSDVDNSAAAADAVGRGSVLVL